MTKETFKDNFWISAVSKVGFPIVCALWLMFGVSPKLDTLIELSRRTVQLLENRAAEAKVKPADSSGTPGEANR